jgi:chitinase
VEFYAGTTLLASDSSTPYTFLWSSVAAGTYSIRAVAYDSGNATGTSANSTITIAPGAPTAVAFQASADHATLVTSYELRIFSDGADPSVAEPLAISNMGKPAPDAAGDITVDRAAFFSSLAPGNYVAAIAAIGTGGSSISVGVPFTR